MEQIFIIVEPIHMINHAETVYEDMLEHSDAKAIEMKTNIVYERP